MRLYVRSADRRPDPEPLHTDDRRTILVGMGLWALAWLGTIVLHGWLADHGRGWWVWTPPVGIGLGVYGLYYLSRRRS